MTDVTVLLTAELTAQLPAIRSLLDAAFDGDYSDDDWDHTLGGWHAISCDGDAVLAHAAVVERTLLVGSRLMRAGYVEGVATAPLRQLAGLGSAVMAEIDTVVRREFDLGALSTSRHTFYERLGWERWQGPTYVQRGRERVRTEDEDDGIMVLRFGRSRHVELAAAITCEERAGDDW